MALKDKIKAALIGRTIRGIEELKINDLVDGQDTKAALEAARLMVETFRNSQGNPL